MTVWRYPSEFRALSYHLKKRGVPTYIIAKALGASTRTVWRWVVELRGGTKISMKGWRRRIGELKYQRWFRREKLNYRISVVRGIIQRLLRWLYYRDHEGGYLSLEAVLRGEEPP